MTTTEPEMRPEHREAFRKAVGCYLNWTPSTAEQQMTFEGNVYSFSSVLRFLTVFSEPAPTDLFLALANQPNVRDLGDGSYGQVARGLLIAMNDRNEQWQQVQKAIEQ